MVVDIDHEFIHSCPQGCFLVRLDFFLLVLEGIRLLVEIAVDPVLIDGMGLYYICRCKIACFV